MACCVLIASVFAALVALKRSMGRGGGTAADPRTWRLPMERSGD